AAVALQLEAHARPRRERGPHLVRRHPKAAHSRLGEAGDLLVPEHHLLRRGVDADHIAHPDIARRRIARGQRQQCAEGEQPARHALRIAAPDDGCHGSGARRSTSGSQCGTLRRVATYAADLMARLQQFDTTAVAVGVGAGLLVGLLLGWVVARARAARALADGAATAREIETRSAERAQRIAQLEADLDAARQQIMRLREAQASLSAQIAAERAAAADKLALLEAGERKLREAFEALSAEALRRNSQSFLELAKASMGEFQRGASGELESRQKAISDLVQPIRDSLQQVDAKLQQVERERIGAYASLTEQVRSLMQSQVQLQAETGNLVKALRAPAVRGRWGEIQLRRVVEIAGMLAD